MKAVCLGDSLTFGYGVGWQEGWVALLDRQLPGEFINKGIPGDTTAQMRLRFHMAVTAYHPTHVLIMGGTNDLFLQEPVAEVVQNIRAMVDLSVAHGIQPILLAPPPVNEAISPAQKELFVDADYRRVNQALRAYQSRLAETVWRQGILFFAAATVLSDRCMAGEWYLPDGIHMTAQAHKCLAETLVTILSQV